MKLVLNRISAFLIDILLVMFVTVVVTNLNYLNPYKYQYEDAYEEYQTVYNEIVSDMTESDFSYESVVSTLATPFCNVIKYSMFSSIYYLIFAFLYFVVFTYFNGGATLGKKIFKLKIVSKNDDKVSFTQLVARSLLGGSNMYLGLNVFVLLKLILTLTITNEMPLLISMCIISFISYGIEFASVIVLFCLKNKSLSDYIANTKVISC